MELCHSVDNGMGHPSLFFLMRLPLTICQVVPLAYLPNSKTLLYKGFTLWRMEGMAKPV
jgi:hypothetical protein